MDYTPLIAVAIFGPIIYYFISKNTDESKYEKKLEARMEAKPLISDKTNEILKKLFRSLLYILPLCLIIYGTISDVSVIWTNTFMTIVPVFMILACVYALYRVWTNDDDGIL